MGAFLTNVQVYIGDLEPEVVRARVVNGISRAVGKGFVPVTGDEEGDRTVVMGPMKGRRWITIYDEDTEDQDTQKLERLAKELSKAVSSYAVGVIVHDSDILGLFLYCGGKRVDVYDSDPEYFGEQISAVKRRELAGHPDRWRELLISGYTETDLRRAWDGEEVFAEDRLAKIATVLGWDEDLVMVGYNYLEELEREDLEQIRFQGKQKKGIKMAQGPPVLHQFTYSFEMPKITVGGTGLLPICLINTGGDGKGFTIEFMGSAVSAGLVMVDQVLVLDKNQQPNGFLEYLPGIGEDELLKVEVPSVAILAGPADPRVTGMEYKMMNWFSINLKYTGVKVGQGVLEVRVVPDENPGGGVHCRQEICVS